MAKIGLLTFHRPCNFGANLQAYSSMLYLQSLGHEVNIIDYERDIDRNYSEKVRDVQIKAHIDFVQKRLNLTTKAICSNDIAEIVKQYGFDYVLIGADAVWTKGSNKDFVYFAKWAYNNKDLKDLKICSLSAAQMGQGYTDEEMSRITSYLSRFSVITVRDQYTYKLAHRACPKKEIRINPDPVFMLNSLVEDVWEETDELKDKKYVLMTMPNNWYGNGTIPKLTKWFKDFKQDINSKGYRLVELPIPDGISGAPFDYTIPYPIDPIQWFLIIKHARAFCGIRFHSVVSCISNAVPFFSIDTYSQSNELIGRLKYNFHLYPIIQPFESHSKIRNLIKGSSLESFRLSTSINVYNPKKLANKILSMDIQRIKDFREEKITIFKENIKYILQ